MAPSDEPLAVDSRSVEDSGFELLSDATSQGDEGESLRWLGVIAYIALVVIMMIIAIGPSNLGWSADFVARGPDTESPQVVPGDHIQLAYLLWLWHDSITGFDHWPWVDPYLFGADGAGMVTIFGWPLVVLSLPVSLIWGPIAAYNATLYASFVLAAVCAAAWLSTLRIGRIGAAVGGLAFAFAPFRIMQSTGHHNALVAWMFPTLLLCLEKAMRGTEARARGWGFLSVFVLSSIILGGESHHSVFAAYLTAVYIAVRLPNTPFSRVRLLAIPAALGVLATGALAALIHRYVIRPSNAKGGRAMSEAAHFAPRWIDLISPNLDQFERYVYVGAVIGLLATTGFVCGVLGHRHRPLAVALAGGFLICCWFSVAPSLVGHPSLQATYRLVPFFSFSRVPGRLMLIGALLLAALAAIAIDSVRAWARPWILIPLGGLILIDLPLPLYNKLQDGGEPYAALADQATILELPVRDSGDFAGSIYTLQVMKHPGPRISGYYVYVPTDLQRLAYEAASLEARPRDSCAWRNFQLNAKVDYVAVHRQLIDSLADATWLETQLATNPGLQLIGTIDGVTMFEVVDPTFGCQALVS
jgi:hypothetical protein